MGSDAQVEILGIRHHGPGSARAVARALDQLAPSVVVIEGPPELNSLVPFVGSPALRPPVAGLVYDVEEPRKASFYPMAIFSPEWVAMKWAVTHGVEVQFADLPATNDLAIGDAGADGRAVDEHADDEPVVDHHEVDPLSADVRRDPIGALAAAAGYDDAERWWEDAIEQRMSTDDPLVRFGAVRDAMAEFRAGMGGSHDGLGNGRVLLLEREAAMRKVLRAVVKASDGPVAVVCGAFHAPVLHPSDWPSAASDNALLKGLPKTKVAATWAPWTSARLAFRSGYGAGVEAPRWYEHLFTVTNDVISHWMVDTARLLRGDGYDASSASAVEATRLAETLAALRGRPLAGLAEVTDAAVAVLGHGSTATFASISERLFVGSVLGTVPSDTPLVPLAEDLAKQQRSLRLKPSAEQKIVTADLRQPSQLARSVLFHRLAILDVMWAHQVDTGRTGGTFKEAWQLEWVPELAVSVIEASLHGTTIETAASSKIEVDALATDSLSELAALVEACLLAELPQALASVLDTMAVLSAAAPDHLVLMGAVEPLARTRRYGDVRGIDTAVVHDVLHTMASRASIGLATACVSLNDEAAAEMRQAVVSVERGVTLVEDPHLLEVWRDALVGLSPDGVHGSVAGSVARILVDSGRIELDEAARRLQRALSLAAAPADAAAWLDGFLEGDVSLLLHDPQVFSLIDTWLCEVDDGDFEDLLPLVRRTFAHFETAERRQIGELVSRTASTDGTGSAPSGSGDDHLDVDRAAPAVAKVADLLGLRP